MTVPIDMTPMKCWIDQIGYDTTPKCRRKQKGGWRRIGMSPRMVSITCSLLNRKVARAQYSGWQTSFSRASLRVLIHIDQTIYCRYTATEMAVHMNVTPADNALHQGLYLPPRTIGSRGRPVLSHSEHQWSLNSTLLGSGFCPARNSGLER